MWDKIESIVDKHWWLPLIGIFLLVLLVAVVVDNVPDYAVGAVFVFFWFSLTVGVALIYAAFAYRFWAIIIGSTLILVCLIYVAWAGIPSVPDKETIQATAKYGGIVTALLNLFGVAYGYYDTHGRL